MPTDPLELVPLRSPIRRDLQTSNPRKLFRVLKNQCIDLGYEVTDELRIEDDPVGELGYVDGRLGAKKHLEYETTSEPIPLPISGSTAVALHHLLLALAVLSGLLIVVSYTIDLPLLALAFLTSSVLTGVGWLITRPTTVTEHSTYAVLVEIEGELYEREETARHADQRAARETNLTSELTVTITPSLADPTELIDPEHYRRMFTQEVKQLAGVLRNLEHA